MTNQRWDARLEGGPFDGDEGEIERAPHKLWVIQEEGDGEPCWYDTFVTGSEVYLRSDKEEDSKTCRYVYADVHLRQWVRDQTAAAR